LPRGSSPHRMALASGLLRPKGSTAWANAVCPPRPKNCLGEWGLPPTLQNRLDTRFKPSPAHGTHRRADPMRSVPSVPILPLDMRFKPSPAHGTHRRADPMRSVPSVTILWLEVRTLGLQNPCPPLGVTIVKNFTPPLGVTIVKKITPSGSSWTSSDPLRA